MPFFALFFCSIISYVRACTGNAVFRSAAFSMTTRKDIRYLNENSNISVKTFLNRLCTRCHRAICVPAREMKTFQQFSEFFVLSCVLARIWSTREHLVSRFWLLMTAVRRTRHPHTPHQEHPSIGVPENTSCESFLAAYDCYLAHPTPSHTPSGASLNSRAVGFL